MMAIARTVTVSGYEAGSVVEQLVAGLGGDGLRLAVVFADWRVDPAELAGGPQRALPAPLVGRTTIGVIGTGVDAPRAAAVGLYGDWLQVGSGLASDHPPCALAHGRDAVPQAAAELGRAVDSLDSAQHVAIGRPR